jgi:hypothetical protein
VLPACLALLRRMASSTKTAAGRHLGWYVLASAAVIGGIALLAAGLLALLAMFDPFDDPPHPTDAAMLALFQKQRPALEALAGMIKQDPQLQRLASDFTRPEDVASIGVSAERVADYRSRLQAAGIARGFSHYGDAIEFIVSTRGLAISGSAKSFVYATEADSDARVVDGDLDDAAAALTDKEVLLQRKIDGGWWLQLDMR